ncbi:hypothetical protein PAHAL_5G432800 [Panicum hallii]|uniref:Uncharacterized protein n=1 Tax=Panicum hallii TaxID=206008 RepID=A0A2T8IN53_9POAL|nr:hypothetical protein PAHAL_5G432800 [Panicum hallii]
MVGPLQAATAYKLCNGPGKTQNCRHAYARASLVLHSCINRVAVPKLVLVLFCCYVSR